MSGVIPPSAWQRIPWHPKARLIADLDKRVEQLRREIAELESVPRYRGQPVEFPADPSHRESWTPDQLLRAHAAFAQGSRAVTVVTGEREWQRRRAQVKRDRQRSAQLAIVKTMCDAGASREEIAEELDTSTRNVSRLMNDLAQMAGVSA